MKAVFNAIYAIFSGDPIMQATLSGGGLNFTVAPQVKKGDPSPYPYAVYSTVGSLSAPLTFNTDKEKFVIQITAYAVTPDEIDNIVEAFIGSVSPERGFDYCLLSVVGFEPAKMQRESTIYGHDGTNNVRMVTFTYSLELETVTKIRR